MADNRRGSFIARLVGSRQMVGVDELNRLSDPRIQGPLIERRFIESLTGGGGGGDPTANWIGGLIEEFNRRVKAATGETESPEVVPMPTSAATTNSSQPTTTG